MEMEEKDPELNVPNWMAFLIVLSCAVSTAIADSKAYDDFCFTIWKSQLRKHVFFLQVFFKRKAYVCKRWYDICNWKMSDSKKVGLIALEKRRNSDL